jgi:hypothetical protein
MCNRARALVALLSQHHAGPFHETPCPGLHARLDRLADGHSRRSAPPFHDHDALHFLSDPMVNERPESGVITDTSTAQITAPAVPDHSKAVSAEAKTDAEKPARKQIELYEPLNIAFPGKEPEERFRFYFRQHWIRLIPPLAKTIGWTLLLFFASAVNLVGLPLDDTTRRFILVPLTIFFVIFQMHLMRRWYEYFLHIVIVTDIKIHRFKRRFLLMENEWSVDIPSIRDIKRIQHGPVQVLLGYGTIILDTAQGELDLHFTPELSKLHDALVVEREENRPGNGKQAQLLKDVKRAVQSLQPYTE